MEKVIEGNFGSWSHQIMEFRERKISQKEINAADHLVGHRWGIKEWVVRDCLGVVRN